MSRSGYHDDCENPGLWDGIVKNASKGRRGKAFFHALIESLDAMSIKELVKGNLVKEGAVCAIGAVAAHKKIEVSDLQSHIEEEGGDGYIDTCSLNEQLADRLDIAKALAQEVQYENDEGAYWNETPAERWERMRKWAQGQLENPGRH